VTDPILLFLTVDVAALLLLGTFATALPLPARDFLATTLAGLGLLLCLPSLLTGRAATELTLPIGPPGLSLSLALDPLSAFFLAVAFLATTAIAAFQATTTPLGQSDSVRTTAFSAAGTAFSLLAADGVTLAIGLAVTCGAICLPGRNRLGLLVPLLLLAAVGLLAAGGFAPGFAHPDRVTAAAALTIAAVIALAWVHAAESCWTRNALAAGVLVPSGTYLLLRLIASLADSVIPTWSGSVLILAGGAIMVVQGWRAADHPDIDGSVACLARRQAGLAMTGAGLALIARIADLPAAESFALAATFLSVIGGGVAGVVTSLAAQAMGASAGTCRLSRLGGLIHTMPATSAALAVGLFGLSTLPPGLGFATLWLMFQAILAAPRTGGLVFQLPLALTGGAIALSAALATAASVRLIGIAVLGRPRTPRGAGARESQPPARTILLTLAALSALAGVLPGTTLWLLAAPAIRTLTGTRSGLAWASPSTTAPGYLALPVLALLALATGGVILATRWSHKEAKIAGPWTSGMEPPVGLPFGEPAAQSAGAGFLPPLPDFSWFPRLRFPALPMVQPPSATVGVWLVLAAFGVLLLVLGAIG
jgi:formate hydrogenlyase subunit 3/multisubunit Na+/H+ antiporter MnhD subunit